MSENTEFSHLEPLESELLDAIDTVFTSANEMAKKWGYAVGDRIIAEHHTPDGQIDARYEVHISISKAHPEASL